MFFYSLWVRTFSRRCFACVGRTRDGVRDGTAGITLFTRACIAVRSVLTRAPHPAAMCRRDPTVAFARPTASQNALRQKRARLEAEATSAEGVLVIVGDAMQLRHIDRMCEVTVSRVWGLYGR